MKLDPHRVLQLLLSPVGIFVLLLLSSCVASFAMVYATLAAHQSPSRGDYLRLETAYYQIEFPRNWFAWKWEEQNESAGTVCTAMCAHLELFAVTFLRVLDQKAMQRYMIDRNLTDAFSVNIYEANQMYDWSLQSNENATMFFVRNDTMRVSRYAANYTDIIIVGGLKQDEGFYNLTSTIVSLISPRKLTQIFFYGKEEDCDQVRNTFQTILETIDV